MGGSIVYWQRWDARGARATKTLYTTASWIPNAGCGLTPRQPKSRSIIHIPALSPLHFSPNGTAFCSHGCEPMVGYHVVPSGLKSNRSRRFLGLTPEATSCRRFAAKHVRRVAAKHVPWDADSSEAIQGALPALSHFFKVINANAVP
jgi:hypothetical protein